MVFGSLFSFGTFTLGRCTFGMAGFYGILWNFNFSEIIIPSLQQLTVMTSLMRYVVAETFNFYSKAGDKSMFIYSFIWQQWFLWIELSSRKSWRLLTLFSPSSSHLLVLDERAGRVEVVVGESRRETLLWWWWKGLGKYWQSDIFAFLERKMKARLRNKFKVITGIKPIRTSSQDIL